jgi:hypothetical protein
MSLNSLSKVDMGKSKALSDQIRVSVVQAVLQVLGQENSIRITDASLEINELQPSGNKLTVKLSIDIYPKS